MAGMASLDMVAKWLVLIGGINWGLVGVGNIAGGKNLNLVWMLLGGFAGGVVANLVYLLVGLSALYMLYAMFGKK